MPLQIRRGTNAERQAMIQPLASGELLYVTDDQRLYIGNGTTLGGIQITGYTDNDAKDAAAQIFTSGSHTGISFSYDTLSNSMSATVDLSAFEGPVVADSVKGSVFADDSTLLVDGVSGKIVGPVFANVTGDVTGDLYGTVFGNVQGNVTGNLTGNVTGNLTGYHYGDMTGSVFADDSSLIVDGVSLKVYAPGGVTTGYIFPTGPAINVGSPSQPAGFTVYSNVTEGAFDIYGPTNVSLEIYSANGTLENPTATTPPQNTGGIKFHGYSGTQYQTVGGIFTLYEGPSTDPNDVDKTMQGTIALAAGNGTNVNFARLNSLGQFNAPTFLASDGDATNPSIAFSTDGGVDTGFFHPGDGIICVSTNAVEKIRIDSGGMRVVGFMKVGGFATGSLPAPAEAGMIVLDTTTGQFKGYNGSSWVVLG